MAHRLIILSLIGLFLTATSTAHARCITDITEFDPDEVPIQPNLDREDTIQSVMHAFVIRGWRITGVDPESGYVDAELPIRAHVARLRARISRDVISFHYRESDNLPHGWKVENTGPSTCVTLTDEPRSDTAAEMVHPNYEVWVNKVVRTLEGTMRIESFAKGD